MGAPAQNLIVNPGFDQPLMLSGWNLFSAATWDPLDEFANSGSGSALSTLSNAVGNAAIFIDQCVPVVGGQSYRAADSTFIPTWQTAAGDAFVRVLFFASANCAASTVIGSPQGISSMHIGIWEPLQFTAAAPVSAQSARLDLGCFKMSAAGIGSFQCHHDNAFLPEPSAKLAGLVALGALGLLAAWRPGSPRRCRAGRR